MRAKALEAERAIAAKAAEHVESAKRLKELWDFEAAELCEIAKNGTGLRVCYSESSSPTFPTARGGKR